MESLLKERFAEKIKSIKKDRDELTIEVSKEDLVEICKTLRDDPSFKFNYLSDITGVDWFEQREERFELVYHLYSLETYQRLRVKVRLKEGEKVKSVVSVWPTANWHERECYDLLGIEFEEHPGLERILTPYGFEEGYPLRKDYPLRGK